MAGQGRTTKVYHPDRASISLVMSSVSLLAVVSAVFAAGRYTGVNDQFNEQVTRNSEMLIENQQQIAELTANVVSLQQAVNRLIERDHR